MTAHQKTTLTVRTHTVYTVNDRTTLLAAAKALAAKLGTPVPGTERDALRALLINVPQGMQERPGDYGLHRSGTVLMATDDDTEADRQGRRPFPEVLLNLVGESGPS